MTSSPLRTVVGLLLALAATSSATAISAEQVQAIVPNDTFALSRPDYRMLVRALARYRSLAADTTIPDFPAPPVVPVRPGDALPGIGALRARLVALGDLDAAAQPDSGTRLAEPVTGAVRAFQRRHGLAPDGIIGPATLAQLQVPLTSRIQDIQASLDRIRAEPRIGPGSYIVINVPAFRLFAFNGEIGDTAPDLDMKVIVGRAGRTPTPSLAVALGYLDFWPAWTVPWSIVVSEIIPILRRDTLYLRRENMELVGSGDVALGDSVTPAVVRALHSGALRLRQRSGSTNPLGRVKFVIPNNANIFLHDTPARDLFSNTRRDFSHGCIRLEGARALAIWAMRGDSVWNADSIDAAMAGPGFRRLSLPRGIPVLIEYNTAMATADGRVWFSPDIYLLGRDPRDGWLPRVQDQGFRN
jgi:L,D-transpeptidase YcbB